MAQANDTVCGRSTTKIYWVTPSSGSTYYWHVKGGKLISQSMPSDSITVEWPNIPGTYQVNVVERTKTGCWGDTERTSVTVNPKMHLDIFGPAETCVGQQVWLYASGANSYLWNDGETTSNIYAYLKDTSTTFQVIGKNVCETDTSFFTIKVHPRPTASFTLTPNKPIVNDPVFLHYTGKGASDWTWYIDDQQNITGSIPNPQISFENKGNKKITLVSLNQYGCSDTMTETLQVKYQAYVYVPNAFSPNQDGINDSFKAIGYNLKAIHMQVYDRWGEQLFESFGVNDAWDGTFKGQTVMEGVYIYTIDAEATDGEHYYLHGNVTILQ